MCFLSPQALNCCCYGDFYDRYFQRGCAANVTVKREKTYICVRQKNRKMCAVISRLSESVIQRGETEKKRRSLRIRKSETDQT